MRERRGEPKERVTRDTNAGESGKPEPNGSGGEEKRREREQTRKPRDSEGGRMSSDEVSLSFAFFFDIFDRYQ